MLLAVAVLTEFGLRTFLGLGHPVLIQKDNEVGYLLAPGQDLHRFGRHVRINRFHQRSADVSPLPGAGMRRVLVLGDSVTFGGVQVDQDETFPAVLEARLRASGVPAEVLNASAGSWAIGNGRAYIQKFGSFGSQVAVLQIGSDDLVQPTSTSDPVGKDPNYPDRNPTTALGELVQRYLIPRLVGGPAVPKRTRADDDEQFARNMDEFSQVVTLLRVAGAKVLIVHSPNRNEVVADEGRFSTFYERHHGAFRKRASQLDVPVVDLAAEWKGLPAAAEYYRDGTHLSIRGAQAVAERLASDVARLGAPGLDEAGLGAARASSN